MSRYITQSDIENVYGTDAVRTWSQFAEDALTVNDTRVTAAINWAESYADAKLLDGPYTVPLSFASGTVDQVIVEAVAKLAGHWLWKTRRLHQTDEVKREMARMESEALGTLSDVMLGRLPISGATRKPIATGMNVPLTGW